MFQNWTPRIITFCLWALAAGSAAFWVLQAVNAAPSAAVPSYPNAATGLPNATDAANITAQVAQALGAKNPIAPSAAGELTALQARFQLVGVLAAAGQRGVALIAVDGKPAKPYRVGARLDEGLQVLSVVARSVSVGADARSGAAFELRLPLLATSATTQSAMPVAMAPNAASVLNPNSTATATASSLPSEYRNPQGERIVRSPAMDALQPKGANAKNRASTVEQLVDDD